MRNDLKSVKVTGWIKQHIMKNDDYRFYAEFLLFVDLRESDIQTAGVHLEQTKIVLTYNQKWVDTLNENDLTMLLVHEISHLLNNHWNRLVNSNIQFNPELSNIAMDMIINTVIQNNFKETKNLSENFTNNAMVLTVPDEYKGKRVFEYLYAYVKKENDKFKNKQNQSGQGQSNSNSQNQNQNQSNSNSQNQNQNQNQNQSNSNSQNQNQNQNQNQSNSNSQNQNQSGQGQSNSNSQNQNQNQNQSNSNSQNQNQNQNQNQSNSNSQNQNQNQNQSGQGQSNSNSQNQNQNQNQSGQGQSNSNKSQGYKQMQKAFEGMNNNSETQITLDDHSKLSKNSSKMSETESKVIENLVENIVNNIKNRGLMTANNEKFINNLKKSKKNYLKKIKNLVSNNLFGSKIKKSYTRLNRYGLKGLKGDKSYSTKIYVILDTSGSMSNFNKLFGFIFHNGYEIEIIQIDTEIKNITKLKNINGLKKVKVHGGGGTVIQPAFDYLLKHKLNKNGVLLLTDGFTDTLDLHKFKSVLILSTDKKCPVKSNNNVKQIVIPKNELL